MELVNSSEKQNSRIGPTMPLSMLLSRTDSHVKKRQSGSKTRSITEKQLSFQAISRMPAQRSHVVVDKTASKTLLQNEPSIDTPIVLREEERKTDFVEENQEEGWFTAGESLRLSQNLSQPIMSSVETQKKLLDFYKDIDGSFMEQPLPRANPSTQDLALNRKALQNTILPLKQGGLGPLPGDSPMSTARLNSQRLQDDRPFAHKELHMASSENLQSKVLEDSPEQP